MTLNKYFSHKEIACKCCGVAKVMDSFATELVALREAWGKPMVITSACRCNSHNKAVGGASRSFHLFDMKEKTGVDATIAVDVSTKNMTGADRFDFAALAMQRGWSVGVHKNFIHIDRRSDFQTGYEKPILFAY